MAYISDTVCLNQKLPLVISQVRGQSEPGTWRLSFKYKDAGPEWNKKMSPSRQREYGMKIPYLPFR